MKALTPTFRRPLVPLTTTFPPVVPTSEVLPDLLAGYLAAGSYENEMVTSLDLASYLVIMVLSSEGAEPGWFPAGRSRRRFIEDTVSNAR